MPLATRYNAYSYPIFVCATHPMSCPKFNIIDELLTNFWCKIGTKGYFGWVVQLQGSKSLTPRCNTDSYLIIVSATHPMYYQKFSITDALLTDFWYKIGTWRYFGWVVPLQGSMPFLPKCNTHSYPVFVSAILLMSCPKFSSIDELLTDFWC